MPTYLPKFDASRQFSASTFFRYEGQLYTKGEAFPAPGVEVPLRKLELLYKGRKIYYMGEETARQIPYQGPAARAIAQRAAGADGVELPTIKPEPTELEQENDAKAALAKKLENAHTHDELFKKAIGIKGVRKAMTKAEIAKAIVDAGRADDGAA